MNIRHRHLASSLPATLILGLAVSVVAAEPRELPDAAVVKKHIAAFTAKLPEAADGDLISQRTAKQLLQQLNAIGWRVADAEQIYADVLPDGHPMVEAFSSAKGKRFMRKVSGEALIYDRMDRIAHEPGGAQLINSLVKLPDGERYAKAKPKRGVPRMDEFLPKGRSGKKARVADYDKPTGRIYTMKDLISRLEQSYQREKSSRK